MTATPTDATERLRDYLNRAMAELRTTRAELAERDEREHEPIAIVSMACRLPGGITTPEAFWDALEAGRDLVGEMPPDRGWDIARLYDPTGERPFSTYTTAGAFLDDVAGFDAAFFGVSPREAETMDPQQRILLEVTWEAIERARLDPNSLRGSDTGVYLGATSFDYGRLSAAQPASAEGNLLFGRSGAIASGRLAYVMDWHGPALTLDTMCSSSLVALHEACKGLRSGDCSRAVVGGTAILSTPEGYTEFSRQGGLARDGRCKAFSDNADGTGWAEGVAVLVLEPLREALRHGRPVLATLRGSALNSDGASNGLTAPSGPAQERVIRRALERAGVHPHQVDLVEAHGTGTTLGDPIEVNALLATYGAGRPADRPLWLGSSKSNLGHAASAAGVIAVMKTVLALQHEAMPRTLHLTEPTSKVDWSAGGIRLLERARPWPRGDEPRRAGVSAFGASGTNAHVILEEAPAAAAEAAPGAPALPAHLLVLSASDEGALREQAGRLARTLEEGAAASSVASSVASTRAALPRTAAVVGRDSAELARGLEAFASRRPTVAVRAGERLRGRPRRVFVFPGQGSQWVGMATALAAESPVFAAELARCDAAILAADGWSLLELLPSTDEAWTRRADRVQPALFAVMVALAAQWRALGVEPDLVVGHSQGEIAAAYVAGALELAEAVRIVVARCRAIATLGGDAGGMLAVQQGAAEAEELLSGGDWPGLEIAVGNGPGSCVVAGPDHSLDSFAQAMTARDVWTRRIRVDYASHTAAMDALHEALRDELGTVVSTAGTVPFHSCVEQRVVDGAALDARYWFANLRERVRFDEVTAQLAATGPTVFIEMSPHPVLTPVLAETLAAEGVPGAAIGSLHRGRGDSVDLLGSVGEAAACGVPVDWDALTGGAPVVALPTYPFQHTAYWLEPVARPAEESGGAAVDAVESLRHGLCWRPLGASSHGPSGRWVVLADPSERTLGDTIARVWRERGAAADVVTIDPAAWSDAALLAQSVREVGAVEGWVTLASRDLTAQTVRRGVPRALWTLVTHLSALPGTAPLWVVTRGARDESGCSATDVATASAVWGLGRVAALEAPERWGGLVDLPSDPTTAQVHAWAGWIGSGEDQVAVVGDRVEALRVERRAGRPRGRRWDLSGTALLVGGTGAIGRQVARWLAEQGTSRVVTLSRRGPDAPGVDAWKTELDGLGVDCVTVAGDAADRALLSELLRDEARAGHPVTSAWHLAGGGTLAPLDQVDEDAFADTIHAKVAGAAALDAVLTDADVPLVLFSSISAAWGSAEHGAYAAANAWLDGLALARTAQGLPTLSVGWGIWDPARGGGMADNLAEETLRGRGVPFMDPSTALAGLGCLLAQGAAHEILAVVDWERFVPVFTSARPSPLLDDFSDADGGTRAADPSALRRQLDAATTPAQRTRLMLALVGEQVAAVLKLASPVLDAGRPFRELGFDSLTAVALRRGLQDALGVRLAATLVFDHPTPQRLAEHLLTCLPQDAPETPDPTDNPELDRIVALLGEVPAERLRSLGVHDHLARLLRAEATESTIDELDDDALVRLALASL